jgi:adenylate kinase
VRLILLGPPGAGKGTQAARLSERLRVPHVSTGDLLRDAVEAGTALGNKVAGYMEQGELVPDAIIDEVVEDRLGKADVLDGFVLDGYPRNLEQARFLDGALTGSGSTLDRAVKFVVTGDEIVERLSARRVCPSCNSTYHMVAHPPKNDERCDNDSTPLVRREDDEPEAIKRRLEVYGEMTEPLFDFYSERGILVDVDAMGPPGEVFERLVAALGG